MDLIFPGGQATVEATSNSQLVPLFGSAMDSGTPFPQLPGLSPNPSPPPPRDFPLLPCQALGLNSGLFLVFTLGSAFCPAGKSYADSAPCCPHKQGEADAASPVALHSVEASRWFQNFQGPLSEQLSPAV